MQLDPQLSSTLARSVNHQSNEIKQLSGDVFDYLGRNFTIDFAFLKVFFCCSSMFFPLNLFPVKVFVPSMVNGTKEKNSAVRSACEQALISLLRIRQGLDFYNVNFSFCVVAFLKNSSHHFIFAEFLECFGRRRERFVKRRIYEKFAKISETS